MCIMCHCSHISTLSWLMRMVQTRRSQGKVMFSDTFSHSRSFTWPVCMFVCARKHRITSAVVIHNHIKYTFIHILCRQCACTLLLITSSSQQLKHNSNSNENVLVLVIMNEHFVLVHQQNTHTYTQKQGKKSVTSKTLQMPKKRGSHKA